MTSSFSLQPELVLPCLEAEDKWQALDEIVAAFVKSGQLDENYAAQAREALAIRERELPTGMQNGVALPHVCLEGLPRDLLALARLSRGVDFGALDGEPCRIILCCLNASSHRALQSGRLAALARCFCQASVRRAVIAADGSAELCACLQEAEAGAAG